MNSAKNRVATAIVVVALLLVIFATRLPAIMLTPDHELWLVSGSEADSTLQEMRLKLLILRGADPAYEYGGSGGYSTIEMAVAAKNVQLVRRFADSATPEQKQRALTLARSSEDRNLAEEVEEILQESP